MKTGFILKASDTQDARTDVSEPAGSGLLEPCVTPQAQALSLSACPRRHVLQTAGRTSQVLILRV